MIFIVYLNFQILIKFVLTTFFMISIIILFIYFVLFYVYIRSWNKINPLEIMRYTKSVSVIIACRNEDQNILKLISCLKKQNFDKKKLELIFINDHSEDKTLELLEKSQKNCSYLEVINLKDSITGKKNAIREGIKVAAGDIILCTDADCEMGERWIETIIKYFEDPNCRFISAPVMLNEENNLFSKYQQLELLSLVLTSAAAIGLNKPTLCNGANIAFRRKDYLKINQKDFEKFTTDDLSLLHYFKDKFKNCIFFIKDIEAIVSTDKHESLESYFSQKMRWISSSRYFTDSHTILISLLVYLVNIIFFYSVLQIIYSFIFVLDLFTSSYYLLIIAIKVFIDFLFLNTRLDFFNKENLLKYLFPFAVIHSIITVVIVPLSFIIPLQWKGRKL